MPIAMLPPMYSACLPVTGWVRTSGWLTSGYFSASLCGNGGRSGNRIGHDRTRLWITRMPSMRRRNPASSAAYAIVMLAYHVSPPSSGSSRLTRNVASGGVRSNCTSVCQLRPLLAMPIGLPRSSFAFDTTPISGNPANANCCNCGGRITPNRALNAIWSRGVRSCWPRNTTTPSAASAARISAKPASSSADRSAPVTCAPKGAPSNREILIAAPPCSCPGKKVWRARRDSNPRPAD